VHFYLLSDLGIFLCGKCLCYSYHLCVYTFLCVSLLTTKGAGQVVVTIVLLISCYLLCCPCVLCCCVDKDIKGMKCMSTSKRSLGNSCRPFTSAPKLRDLTYFAVLLTILWHCSLHTRIAIHQREGSVAYEVCLNPSCEL